jgi:hypothetical protein
MGVFDKMREDLEQQSVPGGPDVARPLADVAADVAPLPVSPGRPGPLEQKLMQNPPLVPSTEVDPRRCKAHTSGLHGEKRPCRNWAIAGGRVCRYHGGSAPQVKNAAQRRLNELLMPAIERLAEIADQDGHLPSALGAVNTILNHTKGKPGENKNNKGKKGPTIIVGIGFGGMPASAVTVQVKESEPDEDFEDADIIDVDPEE